MFRLQCRFRLCVKLASGLAFLAIATSAAAAALIAPADPNLRYTGRIDFSNPAAPVLSWPGSSIEGNFTGGGLTVKLDDQSGRNFFNVFLDGDLARPTVLAAKKGANDYVVATELAPGPHRFLITKRTEGEEGATVFRGLELADGAGLLPPPARKQRRIEFFGDSITSGLGNESPDNGPDHLTKDKNNFMSYASIAARSLDAEAHIISQSGIGVMISWFPFTMPDFYDQLSAVGNNDTAWDFNSWTPDVVVINLLQNDSWLIDREKRLLPVPDDAERVRRYRQFVQKIRSLYPGAYIICALGSMDATKEGSKWPGYIRSAVDQMRSEQGDNRIDTLVFPFTGYGAHPRVRQHEANAALLTEMVRSKLGW
jgi:lysophospholipase L1-like esterase